MNRIPAARPVCGDAQGTPKGWRRHQASRQDPCSECAAAWFTYERAMLTNPAAIDHTWAEAGACHDRPDLAPILDLDHRENLAAARRICASCVVTAECLDDAMRTEGSRIRHFRHGMRGGLTPGQRAQRAQRTDPTGDVA